MIREVFFFQHATDIFIFFSIFAQVSHGGGVGMAAAVEVQRFHIVKLHIHQQFHRG